MQVVTQWIAENPDITTWVTLISILGVIITIIALFLQIKDKRRKAIYYTITSTVLIDNEVSQIKGVQVLFDNKPIESVVISNIKFWNGGNELLEESDFYPEQTLKVVVPQNEKILSVTVFDATDDTSRIDIQIPNQDSNEALISFYCLEPHQGATINVCHTNVSEKGTKITGKIKGGQVINRSIEVAMENGEIFMATGKYKIYFSGGILSAFQNIFFQLCNLLGVNIVSDKKEKSRRRK